MTRKQPTLFMLVLLIAAASSLFSQGSAVFENRKQWYLQTEGSEFWLPYERIWAWLENLKNGTTNSATHYVLDFATGVSRPVGEVISKQIRCYGSSWSQSGYPPYGYAFSYAEWYANSALMWMYLGYSSVLTSADKLFIQDLYNRYITSRDYGPGSENSQLHDMVGRYLYAQYYKTVRSTYSYNPPPNDNIKAFSWAGNTYVPGSQYSTYELTRDWIFAFMDRCVQRGHAELDSPAYTWNFVFAFCALYEFAVDPEMKKRAQIMLDFLLLESAMDYSAKHWGGALGRNYLRCVYNGSTRFYWDFFWDVTSTGHEPGYAVLLSSYRLPNVIWDAADLSDEPDNYYHINTEYNFNIVQAPGTGKWNYVTKFFNLGGIIGMGWALNIKSDDVPGNYYRLGVPFTLWINSKAEGEGTSNPAPGETYLTVGEYGHQYRNSMFIGSSKLHFAMLPNAWDEEQTVGKWRFYREGKTMVGLYIADSVKVSGLEVGIQGVDYGSFEEFKTVLRRECNLTLYAFRNSHGEWIGAERLTNINVYSATIKRPGESQAQFVWAFPFPRIQTIDHRGQYIVRWEGNRMTVKRHGVQRVYDFVAWTVTETAGGGDTEAPSPPTGVLVR